MKIFSWNVNGLRAVLKKNFGEFLESFAPDILCLQETRLGAGGAGEIELGFKYKYFHCAAKGGYSGTAILSNLEPVSGGAVALEGHPDEGRIVELDFGDFKLVDVYVPNSRAGLERLSYRENSWGPDFRNYLRGLGDRVVVCGDFNVAHSEIDLARPSANRKSAGFTDQEREDFSKLLREVPLVDVWRSRNPDAKQYTWWSYLGGARKRNVGWRIDYFLTSPGIVKNVVDCRIHDDVLGSDHCPVSLELKF